MAKTIMLQGTMSNVGKSFLTAALCRIFMQDGFSCAPFKSQNMALNSFVTADGLEMGRAQAMQAEAARVAPSVLMNPVLLKPTTDMGSQVIVNGGVLGNMRAADYFRKKKALMPHIVESFNQLSSIYDIIVIEGAGSPVELNLKSDDIVNMGLAKRLKSPVLLVGDIDRGGVFAQLLGTLQLLEPDELPLVKGLVVNQFRGDRALFQDGVQILKNRSNLPVVGVVPFIQCDVEDEDSLSPKLKKSTADALIDIAVIKLPKISNFTDFDVFDQFSGVSVRYVSTPESLGNPDLVIIPGTKSTIADAKWLANSGLGDAVQELLASGTPLFGICGGYQIMGSVISDKIGCEGGGMTRGLEILRSATEFTGDKRLTQVTGKFCDISGFFSCLSGAEFYGYEIHMGRTVGTDRQLTTCGGMFKGNAAGCYVHGIFDSADVSGRLVKALFEAKNLPFTGSAVDRRIYRQQQFDIMADAVRESLDMKLIYKIIEEGV